MWYLIVGCFLVSACAGESLYADTADYIRIKRQHQQQQPPVQSYNYRPYNEAPDRIKQLLVSQQAREPLVQLPAVPPPQLQAAASGGHRGAPPPPQPQQIPLAQPAQYSPKVQYGQAPQQPTYKGIQAGGQLGPQLRQPVGPQGGYTPQYKPQYQQPGPGPNNVYRQAAAGPPAAIGQYQPQSPPSQYPKNLPPHIQKIIDSQRAYQG